MNNSIIIKPKPFSDIPINHTVIPQSELNIDDKIRSNLFTWNGQFSPQFVESLLKHYAKSGSRVIDPFVGSGTTLCECARIGLQAYGVELNVSAYYMSKTYEIANISIEKRRDILSSVELFMLSINNDEDIISELLKFIESSSKWQANLVSTLIILLDLYNNNVSLELLLKKWNHLKTIVLNIPYSSNLIQVQRGDSRNIKLPDDNAELLITSPPYINVFNYHQKYRRSVECLGFNVLSIAKSEFGSNRKNRGNRFLTVIQYCIDMALSLKEAVRVCCYGSRMIYVVGRESSVLGYSFCNSELIYNLATEIFGLRLVVRQERVFKNRYGKMIFEDILNFSNTSLDVYDTSEIIERSRQVAINMLEEKYSENTNSKNRDLLKQAINKAHIVKPSEANNG